MLPKLVGIDVDAEVTAEVGLAQALLEGGLVDGQFVTCPGRGCLEEGGIDLEYSVGSVIVKVAKKITGE